MTEARRATGLAGELAVATRLEAAGYEIEARNWRCRVGELDIVVLRGDVIAFVEVRSVTTDFLDSPALTVLPVKQGRVSRAADAYLQARGSWPAHVRFDVAAVTFTEGEAVVVYFENAFVPSRAF